MSNHVHWLDQQEIFRICAMTSLNYYVQIYKEGDTILSCKGSKNKTPPGISMSQVPSSKESGCGRTEARACSESKYKPGEGMIDAGKRAARYLLGNMRFLYGNPDAKVGARNLTLMTWYLTGIP